jgi:exoribonuclease-2
MYFAEGQVPMLPISVSEDLCSLIVGKDRAAISFMVRLSPDGEVLDMDIVPSVVRVKQRLTYQDAESLLASDEQLKILHTLSRKLQQKRIDQGAILIPIPDVNIRISQDDSIAIEISEVDTPTRTLVAEFMVLANTLGARYVADQQVPGLFRCQGAPGKKLIEGFDKDLFINFRQRRHLSPAQLITAPKPHSCVGVQQYTTVTSPIRRFLDLVMQQQIVSLVQRKGARFSGGDLKNLIPGMIATQSKVNLVKRLRHRYWVLQYLEKKVGQQLDALIIEKGPRRVSVVLLDVLLEGDLPPNQAIAARPGDTVSVRIAKVSPLDDTLRLEW